MLIGPENQSLNPVKVNMTLQSGFVQLGRIVLLLFFCSFFAVRTERLNAGPRLSIEN
jgi:hypothetical protein